MNCKSFAFDFLFRRFSCRVPQGSLISEGLMPGKVRLEIRNHPELATVKICQGCHKPKRRLKYKGKYCSVLCKNRSANTALAAEAT